MPVHQQCSICPLEEHWQMIAINIILEVSAFTYTLMGVQNYFSNWAEATPFRDQTAARIMDDWCNFSAETIHSDQCWAFEQYRLSIPIYHIYVLTREGIKKQTAKLYNRWFVSAKRNLTHYFQDFNYLYTLEV